MTEVESSEKNERLRRWRLMLGGSVCDGTGQSLGGADARMDNCLSALYDAELEEELKGKSRRGGLGASSPNVARWLGDIREYFPAAVVKVMQHDALERLNLQRMLLEPELLESVEPDMHLLAAILSLSAVMPNKTRETARIVVRKVVEEIMRKLAVPTIQAVSGTINRSRGNRRPKHNEIDWIRTIKANLKNYQMDLKTIIPEKRFGFGRKRSSLHDVILCIDQSGSMSASVVYASIFSAILAKLPSIKTSLIAFDSSVVDLSGKLSDPVDLLFGIQLGGGTDISKALSYCQKLIERPADTVFVLISDLFDGANQRETLKRFAQIKTSGVKCIALLALNDSGAPIFDHNMAASLAALNIPSFACTPRLFPELLSAALSNGDIEKWAAANELPSSRSKQ